MITTVKETYYDKKVMDIVDDSATQKVIRAIDESGSALVEIKKESGLTKYMVSKIIKDLKAQSRVYRTSKGVYRLA